MIRTEYLIIGQGISGTWLSYYLNKAGKDFIIIDDGDPKASSRIAAGVINPVTGRRLVQTWMIDEILPFAEQAYRHLGEELGVKAIRQTDLIDFFPTAQMRLSFMERVEENAAYLQLVKAENAFTPLVNYELGCGRISPVFTVNLFTVLDSWRKKLESENKIMSETFHVQDLRITGNNAVYHDIEAEKIIFCDGSSSGSGPWFRSLPFAANKGEALIAEIRGLPSEYIYKKGMVIVPLDEPGIFWIGASYEWEFEDDQPTKIFREKTESLLKEMLKLPFKILDHKAGLRPATLERRPFVGLHPHNPTIGILNGMGTKGCSLAPFFAKQLVDHLLTGSPIVPHANISRFQKILSQT